MNYYLGLDPGFAFLGLAGVEQRPDGVLRVLWLDVLETRAEKGAPKTTDAIRRLSLQVDHLADVMASGSPYGPWDGVIAESMSHVRNASASTKVGMTWGALVATCRANNLPLAHLSPQLVRKHIVGVRNVPKEAVQIELEKIFPNLAQHLDHVPKSKRNHAYDALAVAVAFLEKD